MRGIVVENFTARKARQVKSGEKPAVLECGEKASNQ